MALWGNSDNVTSAGKASVNYTTKVVTGNASAKFGDSGSAQVGDVISFTKSGTFHGNAVIVSIASNTSLTIDSTAGLSGAAIATADFTVSQLPKFTVLDSTYSESSSNSGGGDARVYSVDKTAVGQAEGTVYETGVGWVGMKKYTDTHGTVRVKKEVLVAMSGITTGNSPAYPALN